MELPFDPAAPLLGIYPENPETSLQKNICTPMFIVVLFTTAKCWKQPKCPSVDEWIKKLWYIYTMEYNAAITKKESSMLGEITQSMKDKYHMTSLIRGM